MGGSRTGLPSLPTSLVDRRHVVDASGLHGDVELRLGLLLADAQRLDAWVDGLATRPASSLPEVLIGPAAGGAVVGRRVAAAMGLPFALAGLSFHRTGATVWRIAGGPDEVARGRAVVVDDAINAGSAVAATAGVAGATGATVVTAAAIVVRDPAPVLPVGDDPLPPVTHFSVPWWTWSPEACPVRAVREGHPRTGPA